MCSAGRLRPAAAWSRRAAVGRAVVAGCWGGQQAVCFSASRLCRVSFVTFFENETLKKKKKYSKAAGSVTTGERFPSLAGRGGREGRPGGAHGALLQQGRVAVHPSRLPRGRFLLGQASLTCWGHLRARSVEPGHAALDGSPACWRRNPVSSQRGLKVGDMLGPISSGGCRKPAAGVSLPAHLLPVSEAGTNVPCRDLWRFGAVEVHRKQCLVLAVSLLLLMKSKPALIAFIFFPLHLRGR